MGNDGKQMYSTKFYNLDAILSVGYRVNSINATAFRRWANKVLKEYLLRGYAVRQQLQAFQMQLDARFDEQSNRIRLLEEKTDLHSEKIDFLIRTNLPPVEGVLFEGQGSSSHVMPAWISALAGICSCSILVLLS